MALGLVQDTPGRAPLRLASPDCHSHLELAREAVALSILMPSISVCVCPCAPSLCCREASQSHPCQTWSSRFHCSIRLRCVVAHLVNPIGNSNTVKATNRSFRLPPSFRRWSPCTVRRSYGLRTSCQPVAVGKIGPRSWISTYSVAAIRSPVPGFVGTSAATFRCQLRSPCEAPPLRTEESAAAVRKKPRPIAKIQ